jgi:two-component system OmpR family response regulator
MAGELVLVVDDDRHTREVIAFALTKAGFRVAEAAGGAEALHACRRTPPDLVVLDVLMNGVDGLEVCRTLRARGRTPIVFVSSRDEEVDRILGLEIGGDDYVTKPFSPRELVARVRAVLRRGGAAEDEEARHRGRLVLDPAASRATWAGKDLALTVTELAILRVMLGSPGRAFRRDELLERAMGDEGDVTDRAVDTHVRRIRRKFADAGASDPIETVHGLGYRLGPCR